MASVVWPPLNTIATSAPSSSVQGLLPTQPFDLYELFDEAYKRIGVEFRESMHITDAHRALRFLLQEWSNRNINLWTIAQERMVLTVDVDTYQAPPDTSDILNLYIRENEGAESEIDTQVARISSDDFFNLPQRGTSQRPLRYWVNKIGRSPQLVLWPLPDQAYILVFARLRTLRTPSPGLTGQIDCPPHMIGAAVSGLAYQLSLKYKDAFQVQPQLKAEYDRQFEFSQREDREKTDLQMVPQSYWP